MHDENTSQTTNTHYLDGFQYTEDHLDFFPHAEGYVNVLDFSEFNYIYTHKDHLGNIRLKYTRDPGTGETEILEENHYYPFGLVHSGYNGAHFILWQAPGTGIQWVPVTSLVGDKYRYKFNGMEYQDELDLNYYDFGARNYDPALGRWMNIDPLAEYMFTHSPYNFAFNNPIYFIDPDGMFSMPWGMSMDNVTVDGRGGGSGGGGFDVRTYDKATNETLDSITVGEGQGVDIHADGSITANNLQTPVGGNNSGAFKSFFQSVSRDGRMDGNDCEDCRDGKKYSVKNAVPCVQCHHTATVAEGNGNFSLKDRQSGYIQTGGNMDSDFIGSSIGKDGVLYGTIDNIYGPGPDIKTKLQFLKYIIDTKTGLGIGANLIEAFMKNPTLNIEMYNYMTKDTIWTMTSNSMGKPVKGYYLKQRPAKGFIIDGDTLR